MSPEQKAQLIEKFKSELESADWNALKTHHERDALFVVSGELDLYEVACSIATDDVENVKSWIAEEKLRQPNEEDINIWAEDEYRKLGSFLILQPYVILQLGM